MSSETSGKSREQLLVTLGHNWRAEKEGAATYRELANMEPDSRRKGLLLKLAEAEERQCQEVVGADRPTGQPGSVHRRCGDLPISRSDPDGQGCRSGHRPA